MVVLIARVGVRRGERCAQSRLPPRCGTFLRRPARIWDRRLHRQECGNEYQSQETERSVSKTGANTNRVVYIESLVTGLQLPSLLLYQFLHAAGSCGKFWPVISRSAW